MTAHPRRRESNLDRLKTISEIYGDGFQEVIDISENEKYMTVESNVDVQVNSDHLFDDENEDGNAIRIY